MDKKVIEARNRERLSALLPEVRAMAERHIVLCEAEGITLLVTQAYRSIEDQAALYAAGRTTPGRIVTNARPGHSWHNFRRAYDVAVVEDGTIVWTGPKYTRAGELGKSLGLTWGGDFRTIRGDIGHFEHHPNLTLAEARKLLV